MKENNIRVTPQRKAILHILDKCRGHHLETENIYQLLALKEFGLKKTGMATVYRTLELFNKIGLVSKLSMENSPARYELVIPDGSCHHHLVCLVCGKVQEIDDKLAEGLKDRVLQDKGFMVGGKPIKIYGYCSSCRESS